VLACYGVSVVVQCLLAMVYDACGEQPWAPPGSSHGLNWFGCRPVMLMLQMTARSCCLRWFGFRPVMLMLQLTARSCCLRASWCVERQREE
jgi:hypothetical protein